MKSLYLDFEYWNTSQNTMSVCCCAVCIKYEDKPSIKYCFWLRYDECSEVAAFKEFMRANKDELFLSYNVIAEASALYSLGIDPTKLKWVDIMTEWKQLRNGNHKRLYGPYIDPRGKPKKSTPPPPREYGEEYTKPKGANHSHTGTNLLSCVYNLLGVDLGGEHKKAMVTRILQGDPFSDKERTEICEYALSDVHYLSDVTKIIAKEIMALANISFTQWLQDAQVRGEWSA